MEFQCRLGTAHGEIIEGVYIAEDEARLRRDFEDKGLLVLAIRQKGAISLPGLPTLRRKRRIKSNEFLLFNQELATLLKAGMPLAQSLEILRQQLPNPTFKAVLDDVYEKVRSGVALSEAFGSHGDLFPPMYTASLLAGEKSGNLDQVLRRFIAYTRLIESLKRNTVSAMVYPAVLFALSIIVILVIMVKVVPAFTGFYDTFGAQLPFATRLLTAVSNAIASQIVLLTLALVGLGLFVWTWLQNPDNRARSHGLMLQLPGVGPVAQKFATSQFSRTLATLLGGGIPLVTALEVASKAIGNRYVARQIDVMTTDVREGQALARAMTSRGVFPDVALKMVEVGEATGALQEMLNAIADFFDEDIETTLARFTRLIEPVMLIIMAVVIASILLALYLPVFQLSSAVG